MAITSTPISYRSPAARAYPGNADADAVGVKRIDWKSLYGDIWRKAIGFWPTRPHGSRPSEPIIAEVSACTTDTVRPDPQSALAGSGGGPCALTPDIRTFSRSALNGRCIIE